MVRQIAKSLLNRAGFERTAPDRLQAAFADSDGQAIFFLHIGKNAGTQIRHLLEQIMARGEGPFVSVPHRQKFEDLPDGARYFFSIRDPIERFRSGFYSRKRRGAPRVTNEWTAHEARAFARFEHANELAEALFMSGETGDAAWAAAQSISHNAMHQSDWFASNGFALETSPPIAIIRAEHLEDDFATFLRRAGLKTAMSDLEITKDPIRSHANDYSAAPPLSERARENLQRWYARDIAFYSLCSRWIDGES
ncbi:MAG: sulfotransferase family 2 domain-containing protein [Pseudomonadota bacterium]